VKREELNLEDISWVIMPLSLSLSFRKRKRKKFSLA